MFNSLASYISKIDNLTTTNVHRGQRLLMDHDDPSSEELDCYCTDHR